jgi:hypothetical protein
MPFRDADLVVSQEGFLISSVRAVLRAGPKEEGRILDMEINSEGAYKKLIGCWE